jgi:hypothetical protein
VEALKPLARTISIVAAANDLDSFKYATKWLFLFKKAGWNTGFQVQLKAFTLYMPPLVIAVAPGDGRSEANGLSADHQPANLRNLVLALQTCQPAFEVQIDESITDQDMIELVVGNKP